MTRLMRMFQNIDIFDGFMRRLYTIGERQINLYPKANVSSWWENLTVRNEILGAEDGKELALQ